LPEVRHENPFRRTGRTLHQVHAESGAREIAAGS
jgi:hypothetical protein